MFFQFQQYFKQQKTLFYISNFLERATNILSKSHI